MRFPLKLNRGGWPATFTGILPAASDPRQLCVAEGDGAAFTAALSALKFDTTFKTTAQARFPRVIEALTAIGFNTLPKVLDVGASDGTTSLDVMRAIPFSKYFVTDRNIEVLVQREGSVSWFYTPESVCILAATDHWVAYPDCDGAWPFFGFWIRRLFGRAPSLGSAARRIELISPRLRELRDDRVVVMRHDVFEPWVVERVDLVLAANILNRTYFSDGRIRQALANLIEATVEGGLLAIVDSRKSEHATIFRIREGTPIIEVSINGGTDIEELVLTTRACTQGFQN